MNRSAQNYFDSLLLVQSLRNDSHHPVIILIIIARIELPNFRKKLVRANIQIFCGYLARLATSICRKTDK